MEQILCPICGSAGTGGFLESFLEVSPYTKEIYAVENAENAKICMTDFLMTGYW